MAIAQHTISIHEEFKLGLARTVIRLDGRFVACFQSRQKAETEKMVIMRNFNALTSAEAQEQYVKDLWVKNSMYE